MSFHLGQSQTPWDVTVSEVDLPANMHFHRWGPVGQIPNPIDMVTQFIPGLRAPAPVMVPETATQKLARYAPVIAGAAVFGGVAWYILKRKK